MKFYLKLPLLLIAISILFCACSSSEGSKVSGGTEAESTIAFHVQLKDGSPAALARVRVLPNEYLSDGINLIEWNNTDENGFIDLGILESGLYKIEVRRVVDSIALGAIIVFDNSKSNAMIDTICLKELSKIEGYVAQGQGPSVVRIPGTDRFVIPDSSGHFVIDSLPIGNFDIFVESRSNRGNITLQANAGDSLPVVTLGEPRGFAIEDFESFSGQSRTGKILGDGWWYTMDFANEKMMPLWDETLTRAYSGNKGCASGGCAKTTDKLGFLLGAWKTDYALPSLDTLMFSARGNGKVYVSLIYGDADSIESGFRYELNLSKIWQSYAIPVSQMKPFGKAKEKIIVVSRIDFEVKNSDTLYLDDVFLHGIDEGALNAVSTPRDVNPSVYPDTNWEFHDELLKEVEGFALGVRGGAGLKTDKVNHGEICIVKTTDDYIVVNDSTVVIAPNSLRECAYKDNAVWIIFEKSGTYNLQSPLRIKSFKTIDGRGRDILITGMGIQTDSTSHLIFENLTFTNPAITALDTSSRRALSIHQNSSYIWVDHCKFEEYPLVEMDVKRASHHVTISWSRFENAQTGILFGLEPDIVKDSLQSLTLHHNYFANMSKSGVYARYGNIHAYNNFFLDLKYTGIECTDAAKCYIEANIFNIKEPVKEYRLFDSKNNPIDSTKGYPFMQNNWYAIGGNELEYDSHGFEPEYKYTINLTDADLAWKIKEWSGPR